MEEIEWEIKMVNFSWKDKIPRQSHIKACIETWRQRYQKRMNPWLGRQGSCLYSGNLMLSSSHRKENRTQNIQNNDPMWRKNKEKFEKLSYFTLWFNMTSFPIRSEDLSRHQEKDCFTFIHPLVSKESRQEMTLGKEVER